MSVYASAYVWENSKHSGSELLLLLAIADMANEHGIAWPGVATLARRIRMEERSVQRLLAKIRETGELKIKQNAGPKGTHLYQIHMVRTLPLFAHEEPEEAPVKGGDKLSPPPPQKVDGGGDKTGGEGVTSKAKRGDIAVSPEPSGTVKNRHMRGGDKSTPPPPSPTKQCWEVYKAGMLARYKVEPPPSARSNGQLSQVVKQLGAEGALQVTGYFVRTDNEFYRKVRHDLKYLLKDAQTLYVTMKEGKAPTTSRVKSVTEAYFLHPAGDEQATRRLPDQAPGDPAEIADRLCGEYTRLLTMKQATGIVLVQAGQRHEFSIATLRAQRAARATSTAVPETTREREEQGEES